MIVLILDQNEKKKRHSTGPKDTMKLNREGM